MKSVALKGFLGFITALVILIASASVSLAISAPDSITITKARGYSSTNQESGDAIFILEYEIDYASPPTEVISDTFICSLIDIDGITPLKSSAPVTSVLSEINYGYGTGICSVYLSATEVSSVETSCSCTMYGNTSFRLQVKGNPSFFASPVIVTTGDGSLTWRSNSTTEFWLEQDVAARSDSHGVSLSSAWGVDLVEVTSSGRVLTADGEDYFQSSIVGLRTIAPDIFSSTVLAPNINDRSEDPNIAYSYSYSNTLISFWDATSFKQDFVDIADFLGIPEIFLRTLIATGISLTFAVYTIKFTGDSTVGTLNFFAVFGLAALVGMIHIVFIALLIAFATLAIAYVFALRNAG